MNSQAIKIKYIQCNRGGFHEGELLNIVCLNDQCKSNSLCCCVCVDELHKGHKTTTLKKILIESKEAAKEVQTMGKEQVKKTNLLNNDIICNLVQSSKKDTFQEIKIHTTRIRSLLQKIQEGITSYYHQIQQSINHQDESNPSMKIFESIENIQGASSLVSMQSALKKLFVSLQEVKKNKLSKSHRKQLAQDSFINLISNSNQQVSNSTISRLTEIQNQLKKGFQIINKSTENVKSLFIKQVFYFSSELKSKDVWLKDSNTIVSKKGQQYQVAIMEPGMCFIDDLTVFRFKIKKCTANWIALGMCHRKILQKKNFTFDFKTTGHGCYMISANAGSWSHISEQLNNKVKAFGFKQGDTISCIVNKSLKTIFFTKELKLGMQASTQRQTYELAYINDNDDQLHPCVVFYYENDEVQYLPAINLNSIPKFQYFFSNAEKHSKIQVINNRIIRAIDVTSEYRAALLNKSLQENFQQPKKFSFKILKSTNNWVAVGMCHSKTAANCNYRFDFKGPFHGYYMISSNGGTWSTIDSTKNNIVKTFKFAQGDIVQCEVIFGQNPTDSQNKIIFKKGMEAYELNFKGIAGDRLYPCAMLHFATDQIEILPQF